MNNSLNEARLASLANFFKKEEAEKVMTTHKRTGKKPGKNRDGSRPNYYIYNKHTQEVIELQHQCSSNEAQTAFNYVARFTDPKLLTLWAVIQQLEKTQAIRYRMTRNGGEEFEITPDHPLRKALEKVGYNFKKIGTGSWKREPALPKITFKVLGE
jgi:hypothetical protein